MFIKKAHHIQTIRSWQCANQLEHLKKTLLHHPYLRGFVHDITYGKGQFSIMTNDKNYLRYFYEHQLPAFFTDESGRFLPDGIYFTHILPLKDEEQRIIDTLSSTFKFNYIAHIVRHERDIQHTYSFFLDCNEHQLLFFIANQLTQLRRFVAIYERQCKQAIEFVMSEKNHLILPYSAGQYEDISDVLQACALPEEPQAHNELLILHAIENRLVKLTAQQANCFELLLQGYTAKDIAQHMNLSFRTIQHYTSCIYERLGLDSGRELIRHYAYLVK